MFGSFGTVMHILGLTLLHFLWQGVLLGIVFLILMRLLRHATAQARYVCAVGALIAISLTPAATFGWLFLQTDGGGGGAVPGTAALDGVISMALVTGSQGGSPAWYIELLPIVVCTWLAGVLVLTCRMILDARYVFWLKRGADTRVSIELADAMERFCDRLSLCRQRIRLGITPHVSTALVVGWLRPMILLPAAIVGQLPRQQLELILAHELAHIRRHDPVVNLFQVVVETVLFYHPVVRMVSRRIRVERENCTDDLVVQLSRDSMSYARALTALEELRGASIRLSIGAVDGDFTRRIRRLFTPPPRRQKGMLSAGIISVVIAVLTVFANISAWQAQQWRDRQSAQNPVESRTTVAETHDHPVTRPSVDMVERLELPTPEVESPFPIVQAMPEADPVVAEAVAPVTEAAAGEDAPPVPPETAAIGNAGQESRETVDLPDPAANESTPHPPELATGELDMPLPAELEPSLQLAYVQPPPPAKPEAEVRPELKLEGGRLLHMEAPDYPPRAMRRGVEAEVRLSFVVDANGRPRDIQVLDGGDGEYGFDRVARHAVEGWRFEPFTLNGEIVERRVEQVVDFFLTGERDQCGPVTGTRISSRRFNNC